MIAMPVSGYLSSNGAGTVVPWFGLFTFPHLLPKNDTLRIAAGQAHYVFAWTIAFVLAAHLGRPRRPPNPDRGVQDPVTAWAALTGHASASGSACPMSPATTEAGSVLHVWRTTGDKTTPTPTR
jgi:hypothetical protein